MAEDTAKEELDEDGLVVQRYDSMVLLVVPPEEFGDQILRYARSSLYNCHVGTRSVSTEAEAVLKGRLQDEFLADGPLEGESMEAYSGLLIAGCDGTNPLAQDSRVLQLLRDAHADRKLIGTWGNGLAVLAAAGILKGRKVTGDPGSEDAARKAGARFTGRQVEKAGHVITAVDEGAGMRFGQALAETVRL